MRSLKGLPSNILLVYSLVEYSESNRIKHQTAAPQEILIWLNSTQPLFVEKYFFKSLKISNLKVL